MIGIPIKDNNPRTQVPVLNFLLLASNILVHFYQFGFTQEEYRAFIYQYGAIPSQIVQGANLQNLFTSMFVHGDWAHLIGNMLYLYIFGDNVENILGTVKYLFFYLLCGIAAALTHVLVDPASTVPMVGASGAISGVLGAYLLSFPRVRVLLLVQVFIIFYSFWVPAFYVLGLYFVIQVGLGLMSLGAQGSGGVAWFAHIGGFLVGLIAVRIFRPRRSHAYEDLYDDYNR